MTAVRPVEAAVAFRRRLLAERTRLLADRDGSDADGTAAAEPDRLVCAAGTRLVALPPGSVGHVRAAVFHPLPLVRPAAAHAVLGAFIHNGLPYSLIELSRLLFPIEPPQGVEVGGRMLLLRGINRFRVALRVDEVLGTPALRRAGDDRHALLPDDRLALLLDAAVLRTALHALDDPAAAPPT